MGALINTGLVVPKRSLFNFTRGKAPKGQGPSKGKGQAQARQGSRSNFYQHISNFPFFPFSKQKPLSKRGGSPGGYRELEFGRPFLLGLGDFILLSRDLWHFHQRAPNFISTPWVSPKGLTFSIGAFLSTRVPELGALGLTKVSPNRGLKAFLGRNKAPG